MGTGKSRVNPQAARNVDNVFSIRIEAAAKLQHCVAVDRRLGASGRLRDFINNNSVHRLAFDWWYPCGVQDYPSWQFEDGGSVDELLVDWGALDGAPILVLAVPQPIAAWAAVPEPLARQEPPPDPWGASAHCRAWGPVEVVD